MTAVAAVAGATMLAGGAARPGVLLPEAAIEPEPFVRAVREVGG
jgi:hypothetical protein